MVEVVVGGIVVVVVVVVVDWSVWLEHPSKAKVLQLGIKQATKGAGAEHGIPRVEGGEVEQGEDGHADEEDEGKAQQS